MPYGPPFYGIYLGACLLQIWDAPEGDLGIPAEERKERQAGQTRTQIKRTGEQNNVNGSPARQSTGNPQQIGEGQKGTPGRGRDRKCHDRASLSRPLVLSLEPLTSLTSFPLFCTSEDIHGRGRGGGSDKMGLEGKGPVCHDIF